jgi:hypothetical protein
MGTFADQQSISTYWFNKAEELRNSAAAVWISLDEELRVGDVILGSPSRAVYFMLCGMSLEALMKAIVVEQGEEPLRSHDLIRLAATSKLTYTKHECELLEILSEAVIWDGRYPVPLRKEDWDRLSELEGEKLFDSVPLGNSTTLTVAAPNEELNWHSYTALWSRAFDKLMGIAGWNRGTPFEPE